MDQIKKREIVAWALLLCSVILNVILLMQHPKPELNTKEANRKEVVADSFQRSSRIKLLEIDSLDSVSRTIPNEPKPLSHAPYTYHPFIDSVGIELFSVLHP